jgi:cytochrome b561
MSIDKQATHTRITRLLHMAIALLVIAQLASSEFMTKPGKDRVEDTLFEIHEYAGIAVFILILGLCLNVLVRARGTETDLLFPWFSGDRRKAVWADVRAHVRAASHFRLPAHAERSPLASAVHGLGILLILAMAGTGVAWFIANQVGDSARAWGGAARETHEFLSNLVWAYLIGHAGLASLNQVTGRQRLSEMWSLAK